MAPIRVAIAGSTGSIGRQTLEVISADPNRYVVVGLSAGSSAELVIEQALRFRPSVVAMSDEAARATVRDALAGISEIDVVSDATDMCGLADVVINGVVGFAGLQVTMATLKNGRRLGLANKESLIAAGPVVQPLRNVEGAELIPVDSEHCALHQCLRSSNDVSREVARLVLTASGGPFRGRSFSDLESVSPLIGRLSLSLLSSLRLECAHFSLRILLSKALRCTRPSRRATGSSLTKFHTDFTTPTGEMLSYSTRFVGQPSEISLNALSLLVAKKLKCAAVKYASAASFCSSLTSTHLW